MGKLRYLLGSLRKRLAGTHRSCPSCGAAAGLVVSRKHLVTALVRCGACSLLFRVPTTSSEENRTFYQRQYRQGIATDLPDDAELERLKATGFRDLGKDFSGYVAILKAAGVEKGAIFDYGCSWGYGSWQFAQAGYEVTALEISQPRREYAQSKLGVRCVESLPDAPGYDAFFSAHVLEHVPSVNTSVEAALACLRPGGLFVAETPNGSEALRHRDPRLWRHFWGEVHPNFLDDVYWRCRFAGMRFYLGSPPYDLEAIRRWSEDGVGNHGDLSGNSLLVLCRKPNAQTRH